MGEHNDVAQNSSKIAPDSERSFAFHDSTTRRMGLQRATLSLGGVDTQFIIDTGSDCNIVGKSTWENTKTHSIRVTRKEKGGPNNAYTSQLPVQILCQFWAAVKWHDQILNNVRFVVIASDAEPSLGIETVQALNLVSFTYLAPDDYSVWFSRLFSGSVGKADHKIKLSISEDVTPIYSSIIL